MSELIAGTIEKIEPLDEVAMERARVRQNSLTKPLEELSIRLAGIQGKSPPQIKEKAVMVMAGDHGVVAEKIGNWPQEVTAQMVANFLRGGAAINVIARHVGVRVIVVDMGVASDLGQDANLVLQKVGRGTKNIAVGPAMTMEQAVQAVETGIELVTGEASSAICAVMTGKPVSEVTGRGTGLTDEQLQHKITVIGRAFSVNQPEPAQPVEVLAKVGGFEIGGLVGVMRGNARRRREAYSGDY